MVAAWACCSGIASGRDVYPVLVVADHLVLVSIVPVLLAAAGPISLAQRVAPARLARLIRPTLNHPTVTVITHPAITFALYIGVQYVFLLTPLYGVSLDNAAVGDAVRLAFVLAGCLFWWPLVGLDAWPHELGGGVRMADLGATIPWSAFLGIDLTSTSQRLARSPSLAETHVSGAIVWGYGTLFIIAALGLTLVRWMRAEDRRADDFDSGLDAIAEAERIIDSAAREIDEGSDFDP